MTVELAWTETGSGDPLVLLHAFPLSQQVWAAQRTDLAAQARVLTPDLRGFGASPDPGDGPPTLDAMAEDVRDLLDRLALDRVVLGGLSMGGYVAMAFLRRYPERVRGLVLVDTKAAADGDAARANRLRVAEAVLEQGADAVRPMLDALLGPTTRDSRLHVVERVSGWLEAVRPAGVAWAQRAMAARPDSFDVLRTADVPALVVVGDEDELTPMAEARAMVEALPDARLMVVSGSGHLSSVERPDAVSEALRGWLDTV